MNPVRSIGIIMDGNRRWAATRGLPAFEGHRAGFEAMKRLAEHAPYFQKTYGLEYVVVYAFSTENWNRSAEEVAGLMKLFEFGLTELSKHLTERGNRDKENAIRVRVIGERGRFSTKMQTLMADIEEKTKNFGGITIVFALSYGGRADILDAVRKVRSVSEVTEETFSGALSTAGIPDPDIIIRTGGEKRLSNFLTWQSVYSELFFPDTLWPDFTPKMLEDIIAEYYSRERRHGT